jgi:hypothetical protein
VWHPVTSGRPDPLIKSAAKLGGRVPGVRSSKESRSHGPTATRFREPNGVKLGQVPLCPAPRDSNPFASRHNSPKPVICMVAPMQMDAWFLSPSRSTPQPLGLPARPNPALGQSEIIQELSELTEVRDQASRAKFRRFHPTSSGASAVPVRWPTSRVPTARPVSRWRHGLRFALRWNRAPCVNRTRRWSACSGAPARRGSIDGERA